MWNGHKTVTGENDRVALARGSYTIRLAELSGRIRVSLLISLRLAKGSSITRLY